MLSQVANTVKRASNLYNFLGKVMRSHVSLPDTISTLSETGNKLSREGFIDDGSQVMRLTSFSAPVTPHTVSLIDWTEPMEDPLRRQFTRKQSS